MCRVLAYLGQPVLIDDLLFKPDSSLVRQSYDPKMLHMLNLAGFGMAAWDRGSHAPDVPFLYKVPSLPVFDQNLRSLALKVRSTCLLAHVRGVAFDAAAVVGPQNLHPFRYDGVRLALAHNGDLAGFAELKYDLLEHIRPEIARMIHGTTDSEWIYALLLSQLDDPGGQLSTDEIRRAVERTLSIIRRVRDGHRIATSSSVNLFMSDGNALVATRFAFDFGCYGDKVHEANLNYLSLWYTFGREYGLYEGEWKMVGGHHSYDSVMVASEPLTRDVSTWFEVPEYSMLFVADDGNGRRVRTVPLYV